MNMDIFQLYQELADFGVTSANASEFVKGFKNWTTWREIQIPTPCRVVYLVDGGRLVALPFLDIKADKTKIVGIELEQVCFLLQELPQMAMKNIEKNLDACAEKVFGENADVAGLTLPDEELLRRRKEKAEAFNTTVKLLWENGVKADRWRKTEYWVANDRFVIDNYDSFKIKKATKTGRQRFYLRPIIHLLSGDIIGSFDAFGVLDSAGMDGFWKLKR